VVVEDYTYIETTNLIGKLAGFYHAFQHLESSSGALRKPNHNAFFPWVYLGNS